MTLAAGDSGALKLRSRCPGEAFSEGDDEVRTQGARGVCSLCTWMLVFHIQSCLQGKFSPNIVLCFMDAVLNCLA